MSKGKDPSAFYEVLKGASGADNRGSGGVEKPHAGDAESSAAAAPSAAAPAVVHRAPMPAIKPFASGGMGENVVRIKYDVFAFLAVVVVGLLFLSFALGVRYGRNQTPEGASAGAKEEESGARTPAGGTGGSSDARAPGAREETETVRSGSYWSVYLIDLAEDKKIIETALKAYAEKVVKVGLDGRKVFVRTMKRREKTVDAFFYGKFVDPKTEEAKRVAAKLKPIFPVSQLEQVKETEK